MKKKWILPLIIAILFIGWMIHGVYTSEYLVGKWAGGIIGGFLIFLSLGGAIWEIMQERKEKREKEEETVIPIEASFMVKECDECSNGKIYPVMCLGLDELSGTGTTHFIMRCSSCQKTFLLSLNSEKEIIGPALRMDFVVYNKEQRRKYIGIEGGRENRMVDIQDNSLAIHDAPRFPMVFKGKFSLIDRKKAINPLEALKKAKKLDKKSFILF